VKRCSSKLLMIIILLGVGLEVPLLWAAPPETSQGHKLFGRESCVLEDRTFGQINTIGLKLLLDKQVPLVLVDARSPQAYGRGHLSGAINLPHGVTDQTIAEALPDQTALLVVYCSSSACPLASKLLEHLKALHYHNLIHFPYGVQSWKAAGFPLQSATAASAMPRTAH